MNDQDIQNYIRRYTQSLEEHGYSPEALGWGLNGRQDVRFKVLTDEIVKEPGGSVLDVGCGFADLYKYLRQTGWNGRYLGIDIVPALVKKAKELLPEVDVQNRSLQEIGTDKFDYVVASGIFNAKLVNGDNNLHIEENLKRMFEMCNEAVCVDFMSSYVDFQKEGAWHTSPEWAYSVARKMSRRILLRSDYLPFEFTLVIYKNDSLSTRNVFTQFEKK